MNFTMDGVLLFYITSSHLRRHTAWQTHQHCAYSIIYLIYILPHQCTLGHQLQMVHHIHASLSCLSSENKVSLALSLWQPGFPGFARSVSHVCKLVTKKHHKEEEII